MLFHGFYNLEHVGDILLARLGEGKTFSYDKHDDLVVLKDQKNNIIGYNLLNASSHLGKINDGLVEFSDDQIEKFNQILSKYDLQTVTIDRNPKFIVGKVVEIEDHPDSDHLHICQVDLKNETKQIVCGAPNIAQGQKVVVALPGTLMPNGAQIWPGELRGVDSYGMICSARELGLPHAPQKRGIMVVPDSFEVGAEFEPTKCDELIASGEITL